MERLIQAHTFGSWDFAMQMESTAEQHTVITLQAGCLEAAHQAGHEGHVADFGHASG